MCSHLFSLHPSIWEVVENEMHFESIENVIFINEHACMFTPVTDDIHPH
jgi:hypothetical protein